MAGATDFESLLLLLARHGVDFVVVGGVAAVLHGAPVNTRDLDIVHARDQRNLVRLLSALHELGAVYRNDRRRLQPDESHLASSGHQLLETRLGDLDLLGSLGPGIDYASIAVDALDVDLGAARIKLISLDRLIAVKEKLARPKDQLMLLQLRAVKAERARMLATHEPAAGADEPD